VAAAVVLLALVVLVAVLANRDRTPTAGPSADRSPAASSSPTSSSKGSPSPSTNAGPSKEQMRQFVEDYLATAPSDPATTWKELTPGFQRKSGGYGSYSGFWGSIESATPGDISADPERLLVSYGVSYVRKDGSTASDSVTLQLEQAGNDLLIAGES
jgi:hypothetical protein